MNGIETFLLLLAAVCMVAYLAQRVPNTPLNPNEPPTLKNHPLITIENRIWKEVLETEREVVVSLRRRFEISDDVMHDKLRDINLLHNRFANHA